LPEIPEFWQAEKHSMDSEVSKMENERIRINILLHRRFRFFVLLALLCLSFTLPMPVLAQTSLNRNGSQPETGSLQTEENIDQAIASIQQSLQEALQALRSAKNSAESGGAPELGSLPEEAEKRLSLLFERVHIYEQHIEAYKTIKATRSAAKEMAAASEGWQGFEQGPPYSISLVDELRGAILAENLKIKKEDVKLSIAQDDLADALQSVKSSEQSLRKIKESLDRQTGMAEVIRLRWLYNLSLLENTVAKAKALAAETQRQVIEEVLTYHRNNLLFLDRKLQVAASNAPFTKETLDKKMAAISETRRSMETELRQAFREELRAGEQLEQARQALVLEQGKMIGQEQADRYKSEEINRLQRVVDARKAWLDTRSQIVEGLKLLIHEVDIEQSIWEKRYRLATAWNETELKESLLDIGKRLEKVRSYQSYFESNMKLTQSLVISQQRLISAWDDNNGEIEPARQTLDAYEKRSAFFERSLVRNGETARLLESLLEEITERRRHIPFGERVRAFSAAGLKIVGNVWNYEIFAAEDTIIVDGQPITERRPVTISKIIRALLILTIGLWLSSFLAHSIRIIAARRFDGEHKIAILLEKAFRAVVIICVVFFALVTVKIPLTIFAFLGGALAIGMGFGAQNLINNFISGIILLFERPIKVGDIVEIEGSRGRVTSIGARCSEVRRFDGIDILVPNSTFLEKNVVNWTLADRLLRVTLSVGVAYGSPTREVHRIIKEAVEEHGRILKTPEPVILFEDFGDNALIFTVYFWIELTTHMDFRIVASDLRFMLDKRLRDAGITIAFPQRDVHFDNPRPIQVQVVENLKPDDKGGSSGSDKGIANA
jgi:potassium efflux system protein